MRIKRWNGSAWVDDLPTVGVSNIETTGTPSSTTFLRGDGAWATPAGSSDADTVDSLHASSFIRSDANDDFSGTLNYTPDTGTILAVDGQAVIQRMTANGALTIGHDDAVIIAGGDTSGTLNSNINNATETVFVGAEGGFVAYAFPNNDTSWSNRKELNWNGTNLTLLGNTVATQSWVNSQGFLTTDTTLSTEEVQDIVGGMVSSNTESGIAVTYDDTNGKLNFNVSDPTITLTGAVTGSATMTNLGNVSIATTATSDPTLTLAGDASGSATFTNLGNATLTVTVADDSHNHTIANVDGLQSALDGKAASGHTHSTLVSVSGDSMTGDLQFDKDGTTDVGSHGVVFQSNTSLGGVGDFTTELNMDSAGNLKFGSSTIFHSGNDGSASGIDADLLDGQQGSHYLDYNNFTNTPTIPTNNNQLTNGAGYVTGSHSHSTSNITSGEFNTARLGSGTATSGYVLQSDGDGTASWAAASSGGEYDWEYVTVVKDSNTLTYSDMDDGNYDYKFVIHCQATATEDNSGPYIRINNDSSNEYSYQYSSITQTAETTETVLNQGDALTSLIYTGADLGTYSNGGSSGSTVHTAEVIVQHSPWSTYPGNYTLVLRGWAQTHWVSQSGTSYDGMVQSTFVGTKDNLYGVTGENHQFDYIHNIAGGSTNYRVMRVYRRERK